MNAWLLTWEGTSGPAVTDENKIIAIVSSRRSSSFIEDLVDILYRRNICTAEQMALEANKRKLRENQYKKLFSDGGRIFYGKNPCIYARVISKLKITSDPSNNTETISWLEPAHYESKSPTFKLEITEPESEKVIVRKLSTLSYDIYEN